METIHLVEYFFEKKLDEGYLYNYCQGYDGMTTTVRLDNSQE